MSKRTALSLGMSSASGVTPMEAGQAFLAFLDSRVVALFEQLQRERGEDAGDPLIRSDKLGPNNRIVLGLIKRGELRGVRIAGRWHVRRSEWERYVQALEERQQAAALATEATAANDSDPEEDVAAVLAEMGLERRVAERRGKR